MSGGGVIGRVVFLEILEHLTDRFIHHSPVEAGVFPDIRCVFRFLLFVVQRVGTGGGWAKIVIDGFASPGRLDQQNGAVHFLRDGEAEGKLRSDLGGVATESDRQGSGPFVSIGNRGDVDPIRNNTCGDDLFGKRIVSFIEFL